MKSSLIKMTLSLTVIAAAMGAILGIVHQVTLKPIEETQTRQKNEALASVLPVFEKIKSGEPIEITLKSGERPLFAYPAIENGEFVGAAIETWTMDGFSGEITVMVGFDAQGKITGYKILIHAETPGLGAKADEWFRSESTEPDGNTGASVKNRRSIIGTSKPVSVSKDGGEIDAITAATITSRAFLGAVNKAREAFEICKKDITNE